MLKALSLLQPWASLLVRGIKRIETRSWITGYRGIILIHASKAKSGASIAASPAVTAHVPDFSILPFGAIIGEARLTDIVRLDQLHYPADRLEALSLEERAFGDDRTVRFAWMFTDALEYEEPIPAKGALGLWNAG